MSEERTSATHPIDFWVLAAVIEQIANQIAWIPD